MRNPLFWCSLTIIAVVVVSLASMFLREAKPAPIPVTTRVDNPTTSAPSPAMVPQPATPQPTVTAGIQPPVLARYRAEAEAGDAIAQDNLAVCYEQGLGMPADPVQAVQWYRKSAAQGFAPAQYHLGECLEYGRGVAPDLKQAVELYRQAAGTGLTQAKTALTRLGTPSHG